MTEKLYRVALREALTEEMERDDSVYLIGEDIGKFGGAYRVHGIPDTLKVVQSGQDPHHFEIVPAQPMTFAEYEDALRRIALTRV